MPTTTGQSTTPKDTESALISRIAFCALGVLLFAVVIVYAVLYFGSVRGEEFSPDSFKRRKFAYLELPLVRYQITPIHHTDTTNDLEKYLATQKLFAKPTKPDNRWDLVLASEGRRRHEQGDARILCQYLDAINEDGDNVWLKWSEDNVKLAKVVWPAVAKVARQELYSFVPELFILARSATTADGLQKSIDETLAKKYQLTAETFEALNEEALAAELFAEVRHHAPERAETKGKSENSPESESDVE